MLAVVAASLLALAAGACSDGGLFPGELARDLLNTVVSRVSTDK